jgi:dimethylhistidine N-methyltransferase
MTDFRVSSRAPGVETSIAQFASDVEYYLTLQPRQLPSHYLYDALGSALFEAICHLPWYRITRAELQLIEDHGASILRHLDPLSTVVELGPGSGEKLMTLIEGAPSARPDVHLVDISAAALDAAVRTLSQLDVVRVVAHQASYEAGLARAMSERRTAGPTLVLFLGSNVGNFDPPGADAFLRGIRASMRAGDALLLGADLIKPESELVAAYDDPLGVTAAFNRNLLVRINRELGANFDLDAFHHRATWNDAAARVEMHLVSTRRQRVTVKASGLDFWIEQGETIWTESSYKYREREIVAILERAGFRLMEQWVDAQARFALTLVRAA